MEAFIFSPKVNKDLLLCCSSPQACIKLRTIFLKNQCCVKEERLEIITLSKLSFHTCICYQISGRQIPLNVFFFSLLVSNQLACLDFLTSFTASFLDTVAFNLTRYKIVFQGADRNSCLCQWGDN